jgi:hypothetical protein
VTLNAQILLQILATENSSSDLSTTVRRTNVSESLTFTNGTGANQAQIVWSDSRTIAADDGDILDFQAGLADDRGSVAFASIKAIYIRNTGTVPLSWQSLAEPEYWGSGPLQAGESQGMDIPAGGLVLLTNPSAAGWIVESGDEQIQFINSSETTAAAYDIILIGEGAIGS